MSPAGEPAPPHVLIIGGTEEAYALAAALAGRRDLRLTSSLAGATPHPRLPAGVVRVGGFGGVAGLAGWLAAEKVALLVDASHPFATRITAQAQAAAGTAGCRYLRLARPGWQAVPGDRWQRVPDLAAALLVLERLAREPVFAAVGTRAVPRLAASPLRFLVRGIGRPASLSANVEWILGRGPFALAEERRLFATHGIRALLTRDSGGSGAAAKLVAARELALPVVLIDRPAAAAEAATVPDVADALAAVERLLRERG